MTLHALVGEVPRRQHTARLEALRKGPALLRVRGEKQGLKSSFQCGFKMLFVSYQDWTHWQAKIFQWDVCESCTGIRDPHKTPDREFTYVDISAVDNRTKRIVSPQRLLGRDAPSRAKQVILSGDVLLATTRPNLNAVAVVPSELDDQVCSTGFCVLRPQAGRLTTDFLFAFVQSAAFVRLLSDLVKGALYPAVTNEQVLNQPLPLPSLQEQTRIAMMLNEQMAAAEKLRAGLEAQLGEINAMPAVMLRRAFSGGL